MPNQTPEQAALLASVVFGISAAERHISTPWRRRSLMMTRPARHPTLSDALRGHREVRFDGESLPCPVYQRERLDVGMTLRGPAVLDQFDCTTVICRGQTARVDEWRNIVIVGSAP
jgi:N-methylhydantoinase A/oxoprolinase/acetone carboxylase beta subunit